MACPFGFTSSNAGHDAGSEDESETGHAETAGEQPKGRCPVAHAPSKDERFQFEKDPVSWFYQNQIKSQEEDKARQREKLQKSKDRLADIMAKKGKSIEWPEDADADKLSIHSSELSDVASEVESLNSMVSCANSWLEDSRFKPYANSFLIWLGSGSLITVALSLYASINTILVERAAPATMENEVWAAFSSALAIVNGLVIVVAMVASSLKSKRLLIAVLAGFVLVYASATILACVVYFQPTRLDPTLKATLCERPRGAQAKGKCNSISSFDAQLFDWMIGLLWANGASAGFALLMTCFSVLRLFEVSYVEKRAYKHRRRHERRKQSIPWDKIKLVGPVSYCGAGPNNPAGGMKNGAQQKPAAAPKKSGATQQKSGATQRKSACPAGF